MDHPPFTTDSGTLIAFRPSKGLQRPARYGCRDLRVLYGFFFVFICPHSLGHSHIILKSNYALIILETSTRQESAVWLRCFVSSEA